VGRGPQKIVGAGFGSLVCGDEVLERICLRVELRVGPKKANFFADGLLCFHHGMVVHCALWSRGRRIRHRGWKAKWCDTPGLTVDDMTMIGEIQPEIGVGYTYWIGLVELGDRKQCAEPFSIESRTKTRSADDSYFGAETKRGSGSKNISLPRSTQVQETKR
jgi:hypothetical protein